MRIAVCDDRREQLSIIRDAAKRYFTSRSIEAKIDVFDSSMLFLESLDKTGGCDIALLDICMPEILGTGVAKEIRIRRDKTEIIFLTTSNEYAVDAFALRAAHYLLKPFTQEQFDEAMDRAMAGIDDETAKKIAVKPEGGGVQLVDIGEILYIESQKHILTVYTQTGSCTEGQRSLTRFTEELEKLSPGQFIVPYKGYIVNLCAVRVIEPERIVLRGGKSVPIPKRRYRELQNIYFDYLFGEEALK